jgi:hypothetical protein
MLQIIRMDVSYLKEQDLEKSSPEIRVINNTLAIMETEVKNWI